MMDLSESGHNSTTQLHNVKAVAFISPTSWWLYHVGGGGLQTLLYLLLVARESLQMSRLLRLFVSKTMEKKWRG
jgi:hypothetical protein